MISLQDKMFQCLDLPNCLKIVEEISEALFLMTIPGKENLLTLTKKWTDFWSRSQ